MSKVYFHATKSSDFTEISAIAKSLLNTVITDNSFKLNAEVPIKVHFGEAGNETYIPAVAFDGIIDYLNENRIQTAFIETNVLYGGERMKSTTHIALAKKHGFDRIPVIIADGLIGEAFTNVQISKKYYSFCKIGTGFEKYSQMIVCSHFKGHMLSGFGGAIKQLGMGCAARGGKMDQHSKKCPTINQSKCDGCSTCIKKCGVDAISLLSGRAVIDPKKCIGCAGCIAVCPIHGISHDWEGDNFNLKLAEYALAASLGKQNIYINFVLNITKDCDCLGHKMNLIADNIGVMASLDPVAIDTASLDILQQNSGSKLFESGRNALEYAEKMGMGSMKYEVINCS